MNKIGISLLLVLFLLVAPLVHAAQEAAIKDGKLVITETVVVKTVPDVPGELSADDAYRLVTGELDEAPVKDWRSGSKSYSVGFLSVRQTIETPMKKITYRDNRWFSSGEAPMRVEETEIFSWLFIFVPGLLIGTITFRNVLSNRDVLSEIRGAGLLLFYFLIAWSVAMADLGGSFVILAAVGGAVGGALADKKLGAILGGLAGLFIAICASELGETRNYDGLRLYHIMMATIGGASLAAALAVKSMKGRVRAMLAAQRA